MNAAPATNDMNAVTMLVMNEPTAGKFKPTVPTIINAIVAIKKPVTSLLVTFMKPTIIPKTTNHANPVVPILTSPAIIEIIRPIMKAHLPIILLIFQPPYLFNIYISERYVLIYKTFFEIKNLFKQSNL